MRERTRRPAADAGAGPDVGLGGTSSASRSRVVAAGIVVVLTVAALTTAFIPRTVAEGGDGDRTWRVTVTPGIVSASIVVTADGFEQRASGFGPRPSLEATRVFAVPLTSGGAPTTLVVGPTPPGTDSVRVASDVRGVGEARVQRVAWRRVHVAVIRSEAVIEELVGISQDGRVLDTVSDPRAPLDVPG